MTEFTADGIDRTTTLKVSGLTCGHCVAHVTLRHVPDPRPSSRSPPTIYPSGVFDTPTP